MATTLRREMLGLPQFFGPRSSDSERNLQSQNMMGDSSYPHTQCEAIIRQDKISSQRGLEKENRDGGLDEIDSTDREHENLRDLLKNYLARS